MNNKNDNMDNDEDDITTIITMTTPRQSIYQL